MPMSSVPVVSPFPLATPSGRTARRVTAPAGRARVAVCASLVAALALAGCAGPPAAAPGTPAAGGLATAVPPALAPAPAPAPALATATAAPAPAPTATPPVDEAAQQAAFARWIADFSTYARSQGIRETTLRDAFDGAQYRPRTIDLDRSQPEFGRPVWEYLASAVSEQRVANGRARLAQVRTEADAAQARYRVPAATIAAIWGMESNYGANFGNFPTVDALATLGFEGRRQEWARSELLAALKIIDNGDIDSRHMVGSWAGAMGHTQFLPSSFLAYAVDADGDGRRDIWGSMADVMASTANYLARAGWRPGEPWGVEVQLPPGFDYARADMAVRQDAAAWAAAGLRRADGTALPALTDAAVLLPAGARGPAFLVGPNFRAILRYNNSTSYALAVGMLADRIDGGRPLVAQWPQDLPPLGRSALQQMQAALNAKGFPVGTPDGLLGPATRDGLRRYQQSVGLPADGYPTPDVLQRLQAP